MIVNLVADLTVEQLREEVEFWRANSAAFLWSMKIGVEAARVRGQHDFATIIEVNYMMPHATALELALGGEYHETCEACSKPLLRGQLVFQNTDGGELHADCVGGQPTSTEGFVDPDGQPLKPDSAIPVPHAYDPGFDAPEIVSTLVAARLFMRGEDEATERAA